MKRLISVFLILAMIFSAVGVSALAAGSFDKSVFENSTKFTKEGFGGWKLIGGYIERFAQGTVYVRAMLFDYYVSEGWGPELRVEFYDPGIRDYQVVTAFRANVDDVTYCFEKLVYDDSEDVHGGSVFGGKVYKTFLKDLSDGCKNVSFQIDYEDIYGDTTTLTIEHVHTGDLSDLKDMATYFFKSKAFDTDKDPDGNDRYYGASIRK